MLEKINSRGCLIVVPKNSGLKKYKEKALSYLTNVDTSKIIEVRGEDVPFWIKEFKEKGKKAIGFTGEDLYKEYCLEQRETSTKVLKKVTWDDSKALFGKPVLCLLGPKNKNLESLPKNLTICISTKYKKIAKKYLNFLERKGFTFKKIYINGSAETTYSQGLADLIIDIVYTGSSIEKFGLKIFDQVMQSDFLIIASNWIEPRSEIQEMKVYDPPIEGRKNKLRLDFNENTLGCSPKVKQALQKISTEELSVYPEYEKFNSKLAADLNVQESELLLTNGTDEAIKTVMDTFIQKDDEVLIPTPTFAMFEIYASIVGAKINKVAYNEDLTFPTKEVLRNINENTKLVVLVSPNNPTGTVVKEEDIKRILKKARNAIVIVDEAYYQFYGKSSKNLIRKFENLIITQTFSKAYGLAGLRLGYILSNNEIIRNLKKAISPYSVNSIAMIAANAALDDTDFVEQYVKEVKNNKDFVSKELSSLGFKVYASEANFLLVNFGERCDEIYTKLKKKDILVRNRTKYALLENCIRIGIGSKEQCNRLIKEIKEIIKEKTLLFDMDGVLIDVSESYRVAIQKTAGYFTKNEVYPQEIQELKEQGGYNNDWDLTEALIIKEGIEIPYGSGLDLFSG